MMKIVDKKLCCGCGACADACPKQCITMQYDPFGFLVPQVGEDCVNCGLCKKVCPALNPIKKEEIKAVYKGYHKEEKLGEDKESSSGGLFPALAKKVIAEKGLVVGAVFEEEFKNVKHVVCESMDAVEKCRGSKYIQSKTEGVYQQTKKALKAGRKVLFSGTPCQIAGLRGYLKEDFDNLYTVDFICHGVASTSYWQAFLEEAAQGQKLLYVSFRNKDGGYDKSGIKIVGETGQVLVEAPIGQEPVFGKAFANNLLARDSCGACVYATRGRCSDITLADNIIDCTEEERKNGSSFIFVNTQKGRSIFETIREELCVEERDKGFVVAKMMHLNGPAIPHENREKLLKVFQKGGVKKATKYIVPYKSFKKKEKMINRIKQKIAKLIRWNKR